MRFILASTSPRRHQLLALFGWDFNIQETSVNEMPFDDEDPKDYVVRISKSKAQAIVLRSRDDNHDAIIIAADTTVVDDGEILGKPTSPSEAEKMLKQLRGRDHSVLTALTIWQISDNKIHVDLSESRVPMRNYSDAEIQEYISSGDPLDKAGSYAIQNKSFNPVENFEECFANVVGFPLCHLARSLAKFGINLDVDIPIICKKNFDYTCMISPGILSGQANR